MPAADAPTRAPSRRPRRRPRPRQRAWTPTPAQLRNARAQQRSYVSQGRAVERVANWQRSAPKFKPSHGDDKSNADRSRASRFKRTPRYRKAVRDVYRAQPIAQRRRILKHAKGPERHAVVAYHRAAVARNRELA